LWDHLINLDIDAERCISPSSFSTITAVKSDRELQIRIKQIVYNNSNALLVILDENLEIYALKEELNKAKSAITMIASNSHELRIPLSGVISAIEIMQETISEELRPYHEIALTSARHLLSVVNDVLVMTSC
jgi:signal transduction histidine kinase